MALPKNLLTIYGRNAVLEALEEQDLKVYALHLSKSNKFSPKLHAIIKAAKQRGVEIKYHDRQSLSYISKNRKQDQGVALDIILENFKESSDFTSYKRYRILAIDGVTNPQNLGMIIRSCAAGKIDAIIISKRGTASLVSPLTIKASVGALFKIPIIYTNALKESLNEFKLHGAEIINLSLEAKESLFDYIIPQRAIFILGNETEGVSEEIAQIATTALKIPMNRGVESLNVAVTAGIISFLE